MHEGSNHYYVLYKTSCASSRLCFLSIVLNPVGTYLQTLLLSYQVCSILLCYYFCQLIIELTHPLYKTTWRHQSAKKTRQRSIINHDIDCRFVDRALFPTESVCSLAGISKSGANACLFFLPITLKI